MSYKFCTIRSSICAAIGLACGALITGFVPGTALAEVVRAGVQIGAAGALRTTLPEVGKKYNIQYELKDFRSSTTAMKALDQGEIHIANTTAQHLARALEQNIEVVWVVGWGGGYNVLVAAKTYDAGSNDSAVKDSIMKRKAAGNPVKIGVPTGSMQNAKLLQYLSSIGVDGAKDVEIINVPFHLHPRAISGGEVDMVMALAGFAELAIQKFGAKMIKHLYRGRYGKQEIGFIVQKSLIQKNPGLVQRIVSSHVEAMNKFIGNMSAQIAFEKKYSRFPPSVIETTERKYLRYHYRTNVVDLKAMTKQLNLLGWSKHDLSSKVDSVVDLRFLSKATGKSISDLSKW
jgi:ABC-type nitrate/sulfonate/bicarbonate transport system substrate-binding protein